MIVSDDPVAFLRFSGLEPWVVSRLGAGCHLELRVRFVGHLAELGSGCSLPLGAHVDGDVLRCFLADPDRGVIVRPTVDLPADGTAAREVARRAAADARAAVAAS